MQKFLSILLKWFRNNEILIVVKKACLLNKRKS